MHGLQTTRPTSIAAAAKPTASGDTVKLSNIMPSHTTRLLHVLPSPAGGYSTGTNSYNDKGFAERYSISSADSTVKVIGVMTQFSGTVSSSSSKTTTLKIWSQSAASMIGAHLYYIGFPSGILDSLTVPVTQLGIGATIDTLKQFMFPTPTNFLSDAFFAGYTINYNYATLAGDTLALTTSADGMRYTAPYTLKYNTGTAGDTTSVDTFINVQNATQWSDNLWRDNYTQNDSSYNDLAIFPIVIVGTPSGVQSVTSKGLTLFGAYPNPATNTTNIRFELAEAADATITINDMTGRTVHSQKTGNLSSGTQSVQVSTSALPAGEYIYLVRTSKGDGMAGMLQVTR
jgi:hypothetical protein